MPGFPGVPGRPGPIGPAGQKGQKGSVGPTGKRFTFLDLALFSTIQYLTVRKIFTICTSKVITHSDFLISDVSGIVNSYWRLLNHP